MTIEGGECLVYSLQCFGSDMDRIESKLKELERLASGFEDMIKTVLSDSTGQIEEYVIDHLYSGLNGREKPIRPDYLHDPWFNTEDAGQWYKKPEQYMKWKEKIRPPASAPSYLGYAPRDKKTPNLVIRGDFYDSITAVPFGGGLRIETRGTSFGDDIEKKYGSIILGVGDKGTEHFVKYRLKPKVKEYFRLK